MQMEDIFSSALYNVLQKLYTFLYYVHGRWLPSRKDLAW